MSQLSLDSSSPAAPGRRTRPRYAVPDGCEALPCPQCDVPLELRNTRQQGTSGLLWVCPNSTVHNFHSLCNGNPRSVRETGSCFTVRDLLERMRSGRRFHVALSPLLSSRLRLKTTCNDTTARPPVVSCSLVSGGRPSVPQRLHTVRQAERAATVPHRPPPSTRSP